MEIHKISFIGIFLTLILVILIRESSVVVCNMLGIDTAANIVGLVVMFFCMIFWRLWRVKRGKSSLPQWLTSSSNLLLIDSGFAFLPISAGAGVLLLGLNEELSKILIISIITTLFPLWLLAKISDIWLGGTDD